MRFTSLPILLSGAIAAIIPNDNLESIYQLCPHEDLGTNWTFDRSTMGVLQGQEELVLVKLLGRKLALLNRTGYKIFKSHGQFYDRMSPKEALGMISGDYEPDQLGKYLLSEAEYATIGIDPNSSRLSADEAAQVISSNLKNWQEVGFRILYGFLRCKNKLTELIFRRAWMVAFPKHHGLDRNSKAAVFEEAIIPFLKEKNEFLKLVPFVTLISSVSGLTDYYREKLMKLLSSEFSTFRSAGDMDTILSKGRFERDEGTNFLPRLQLLKFLMPVQRDIEFFDGYLMDLRKKFHTLKLSTNPRIRNQEVVDFLFSANDSRAMNLIEGFTDEELINLLEDNFQDQENRSIILNRMTAECKVMSALKILCDIHHPAVHNGSNRPKPIDPSQMVAILVPKYKYSTKKLEELLKKGFNGEPMFTKAERDVGMTGIEKLESGVVLRHGPESILGSIVRTIFYVPFKIIKMIIYVPIMIVGVVIYVPLVLMKNIGIYYLIGLLFNAATRK